uniref:DUF4585 domain-containing protein n=1 Tax=Lates calcarifer TaxID=8187 RepID=A0A4W6C6W8_LATCA
LIGGHRKHSDGGYSDTSSGGSFLDETDREVSNLTDRAFRSLCIGDEAVYNDADLGSSSPCIQRDRQLAFSHSEIHSGRFTGKGTQGRVSATFQHSFVETSQQEKSLREEQLSFISNGAAELSSQQRRSRSRVSSLIRAFNSEGNRVGAGMDGKLREWNDETSWDKSALMSIQRELSEFSTSYQQNFNSGHFPSAGPFSSPDTGFYSSEVAAVAHMNSTSSFMSASHSKHSMSAQVNCNSNFFIHSEFSPFKVWRDHNRFPFQQGEVSGFMHRSEFPKWYETPMYKELSLEAQPQGPYRWEERSIRHQRNNLAPVVPPTPPRSTSTSTVLQKASAVEKRCESELAGHYPHRKRTQSLGANRLPSQRPSTASPTIEMSRRVRDTISSVKALQQKIKMMTEQNMATEMTANQQGVLCSNDNLIPYGNNAVTVEPNVRNNMSTTPFNISQLLTPSVHAHQTEISGVQQYAVSPQPVEHPPVRAESRGATPDVRMSSYKSRATSLLFNLKDNRKRVKNTYSPTKFKGLETMEKNKQPSIQEPRDTVIDIPDFPDPGIQFSQVEESSRMNAASHQYVNQYQSNSFATAHAGQYSEYALSDYQTTQMQGEMVHHSRFTGFIPENYTTNQLANGQNLHEDLSEEDRRAKEREAIAIKIKERREKQREAERRADEERKAKQIEEDRAAQKEEEMRAKKREEERVKEIKRIKLREEEQRRLKQQEEERAAHEEQQRKAAQEEQQRRDALQEQQRKAAQEEQQRRDALQEQQRKAAQEEQQRRDALQEQQRKAAQEEHQRRAAQEEQKRKAAQEEQKRRAAQEEQQRRAAQEEQRRAAAEEQQRRAAQEEQQRRAAEEQQRRAAEEEKQRRAALEEQQRAALKEKQRRAALEEQQRRALIEEQSRKDVESFATSAADLADLRGLYDYERPESACSFSSDVSRSLGKPPAVPPKSEKALRRAKRLTTRRIKKELAASPHATAPVTLPVASPHASGPASHGAPPKTVVHVPSSPTLHPANHPAPVTQYHVESSYPQSYPLTQRKVLQDLGSGQYFVVDVPVQVKTKTFFDPETGKYVQLNVRESGQSTSRPQPKQTYPQPQLQSQTQVKPQQQPVSQASPAGKHFALYKGYHGYSQGYQPAAINSVPPHRSSAPVTLQQDQQPVRENHSYGYPAPEIRQNSEGHRYSPEKTPYMDTVNDTEKTYNRVYNTHGSYEAFPECDTNSQLAGSSVCENDNSAHSRYRPRDIITMSELEDFMEVSDW